MTDARRRQLRILAAVLLAGVALWALAFWARLPGRLPTDADWTAANAHLAQHAREGDAAILAPSWAEAGRPFLTAMPVHAGYDLARDIHVGTRRWWLLALPDAPRFDLEQARTALATRGTPGEATRIGALLVEPWDLKDPPVSFWFTPEVPRAHVAIEGAEPFECRWNGSMHRCNRGDWNAVRDAWYEVEERPLRCLWAHPVGTDALRITFDDVPLTGLLRGRGAFVGQSAASRGSPVDLRIDAGEKTIGTMQFQNRSGLQDFEYAIPAGAERGSVTFRVTTENSGMRHFCFDAWIEASR